MRWEDEPSREKVSYYVYLSEKQVSVFSLSLTNLEKKQVTKRVREGKKKKKYEDRNGRAAIR